MEVLQSVSEIYEFQKWVAAENLWGLSPSLVMYDFIQNVFFLPLCILERDYMTGFQKNFLRSRLPLKSQTLRFFTSLE